MNPDLIRKIIENPLLHARWLNTLSYLENTGARKIAKCEDRTDIPLMMLKHAAEEFRHAYYLKRQILKLSTQHCTDYSPGNLLAAEETLFYLDRLDLLVSRYLKKSIRLKAEGLKKGAYLLVTYAIEKRAEALYPVYQQMLDASGSTVNVKSIIAEEDGHLLEMEKEVMRFFTAPERVSVVAADYEKELFNRWIKEIDHEIALEFPGDNLSPVDETFLGEK